MSVKVAAAVAADDAFKAANGEAPAAKAAHGQGLTLVHFVAQCKQFLWDRGCIYGLFGGCLGDIIGYQRVFRVCFSVRNGSSLS